MRILMIVGVAAAVVLGIVNFIFYRHVKKRKSYIVQTIFWFAVALCLAFIRTPVKTYSYPDYNVHTMTVSLLTDDHNVSLKKIPDGKKEEVVEKTNLFGYTKYVSRLHESTYDELKALKEIYDGLGDWWDTYVKRYFKK